MTCQVAHCIAICQEKGFIIPDRKDWVEKLEQFLETIPSIREVDDSLRLANIAYSLVHKNVD